jgi:hypothetical protein
LYDILHIWKHLILSQFFIPISLNQVFSEAWPADTKRKDTTEALHELRASGDAERAGIKEGSWEEEMVAICRSKLSVKPHAGRAVLFYSQHGNGEEDLKSKHGGCPVLEGTKWAGTLFVFAFSCILLLQRMPGLTRICFLESFSELVGMEYA